MKPLMTFEQKLFKCAQIDARRLKSYGFKKSGDLWLYEKAFMNGDFKSVIKVDAKGNVSGDVYDVATGDVFLPLRVEDAGGFANLVRTDYEKILEDIKAHCCIINHFANQQANRLAQKIYEKYGDQPSFPWDKFDGYGVFKNPDNNKWYALIMNINFSKLEQNKSGATDVVNLKLRPEKIPNLIGQKGFYPAYHMNKKNWITIVLDDSVEDKLLFELTDESHAFTFGKIKKSRNS